MASTYLTAYNLGQAFGWTVVLRDSLTAAAAGGGVYAAAAPVVREYGWLVSNPWARALR
jgi:hypothetical protein